VLKIGDVRVFEKELEDGGRALGFFNLSTTPVNLEFNQLASLGFKGRLHVRDLWRQSDLPDIADTMKKPITMAIPGHGVRLYKLSPAK